MAGSRGATFRVRKFSYSQVIVMNSVRLYHSLNRISAVPFNLGIPVWCISVAVFLLYSKWITQSDYPSFTIRYR